MCEGVVPTVFVQRTVLHWAYSVLPLVASGEVGTLDNATAWEAEDAWLQLLQRLCQVLTHTVLVSLVGIYGEEADVLHIGGHLAVCPHTEVRLGESSLGLDDGSIFFPFLAAYFHTDVAQFLVVAHRGVIHQINPNLGCAAIGNTCPH